MKDNRPTLNILVVEDECLVAEDLKLSIESFGYQVMGTCCSGEEAIQRVDESQPDLILMDIMLAGEKDGIAAAREIHRNHDIPIIFITAYVDNEKLQAATDQRAYGYITKPFSDEELSDAIEKSLLRYAQDQLVKHELHDKDEEIISLTSKNIRLNSMTDALEQLSKAERALNRDGDLNGFFRQVLQDLMLLTDSTYAALGLFDIDGNVKDFVTIGIGDQQRQQIGSLPIGKGLLYAMYRENEVIRIENIASHPESRGFPAGHPPMRNLMGVSLKVNGGSRGAIYFTEKKNDLTYSDDDELALRVFASELEHKLERHDLLRSLQENQEKLLQETKAQQELIGALQQARDQLLQSEKLASIGQLAAGVAHEINNPVGYVSSNVGSLANYVCDLFALIEMYEQAESLLNKEEGLYKQIMQMKDEIQLAYLKEDVHELIKESQEGVARVTKIVQDLKDFSHVNEAEWQWANIHKGLDSTLNIANNEIKYKAEVIKEYGDLPDIECLPSQLNQVFMNLMVNAAHAIDGMGQIRIKTGIEKDGWVWICISDTGKGIDKKHLGRIFDPFFTTKPVGQGTGLGLSLSHGIVQKHNGRIELDSEAGKGTAFTVWLPVRQTEPRAEN